MRLFPVFSILLLCATPPLSAQTRTAVDTQVLALPKPGERTLRILSPTVLEITVITVQEPDSARKKMADLFPAPAPVPPERALKTLEVTVEGQPVKITATGWKRRVAYAPIARRDLRVATQLYLVLADAIELKDRPKTVTVRDPTGALGEGSAKLSLTSVTSAGRYSPAIHVNQEGYVPGLPKKAMIGYYLGDLGEMSIPAETGFELVNAQTGARVYQGTLSVRADVGYNTTPLPYQKVLQADFSEFTTPGEYRLQVTGLGASLPFVIDDGIAMGFTRTYALGLYHQRSGVSKGLPFTRFTQGADHTAPALVPVQSDPQFAFTWNTIASYGSVQGSDNPTQTAPRLVSEASQLYPFVRQGSVDVSGGHWDAGDYSKYTSNSAELIHYLMFTADTVPGANQLDNLGLPESGDGLSDIMQEAKTEADYLSKLQDSDGGFYFIVYPKTREYESGTAPDQGDQQVVWPKNTSVTAAATAALAQIASSPQFKTAYPALAAKYLQQAKQGWQFLTRAIAAHGKAGAYQKLTFYSDHWTHDDELAWAACELFLATGEAGYAQKLAEYFPNPGDPGTFRWGWWRMSECWGNVIRSYAFAARTGRLPASALNSSYLAACEAQIIAAGDDVVEWSNKNAYATPFPLATKAVRGAGWYFSLDQASDAAAAYQLSPKPAYLDVLVGAMNYEAGTNPVNVTYLTGLGIKRQHEIVSQFALSDKRVLPPSGIPLGNIQAAYSHSAIYGVELRDLAHPSDGAKSGDYAIYDRWSDAFNVTTEFVTLNQARGLLASVTLAVRTPAAATKWKPVPAKITGGIGTPLRVEASGESLANARIVWEARDQEPAFGETYVLAARGNGDGWVEAEVEWPDGRRAFASMTFRATAPEFTWLDEALPEGAAPAGGEWTWSSTNPAPHSGRLTHGFQRNAEHRGLSEHWFTGAASPLTVAPGDTLFAWVWLDPAHPPKEIMISWHDQAGWEHRAYWGANVITYGRSGSAGRFRAGDLPPTGQWVRLTVSAGSVGLGKNEIDGIGFAHAEGRAIWDSTGRISGKK